VYLSHFFSGKMTNILRQKVSLNKRRFQQDGFDLDLAYITENIIAMGFPASGFETIFRNPRNEVKRFFEAKHPNAYKIYNLCIEKNRQYDISFFHNRVARFPFADHQAPPLALMKDFCADVYEWISSSGDHIAAIHCKAGKGRAGMMICCWLIYKKMFPSADAAMEFYAKQRTLDMEGVTIPSQRRYVHYYSDIVEYGFPKETTIELRSIKIATSMYANPSKAAPFVQILAAGTEKLFESQPIHRSSKSSDVDIDCDALQITGDIKVVLFDKNLRKKKEIAHFWFNTAFINDNQLVLSKSELDVAWKDKHCKRFREGFHVVISFKDAEVSTMSKLKTKVDHKRTAIRRSKKGKKKKKNSNSSIATVDKEKQSVVNPNKSNAKETESTEVQSTSTTNNSAISSNNIERDTNSTNGIDHAIEKEKSEVLEKKKSGKKVKEAKKASNKEEKKSVKEKRKVLSATPKGKNSNSSSKKTSISTSSSSSSSDSDQ